MNKPDHHLTPHVLCLMSYVSVLCLMSYVLCLVSCVSLPTTHYSNHYPPIWVFRGEHILLILYIITGYIIICSHDMKIGSGGFMVKITTARHPISSNYVYAYIHPCIKKPVEWGKSSGFQFIYQSK